MLFFVATFLDVVSSDCHEYTGWTSQSRLNVPSSVSGARILGCLFRDLTALSSGGGALLIENHETNASGCTFINCHVLWVQPGDPASGGAICASVNSTAVLRSCATNCSALAGQFAEFEKAPDISLSEIALLACGSDSSLEGGVWFNQQISPLMTNANFTGPFLTDSELDGAAIFLASTERSGALMWLTVANASGTSAIRAHATHNNYWPTYFRVNSSNFLFNQVSTVFSLWASSAIAVQGCAFLGNSAALFEGSRDSYIILSDSYFDGEIPTEYASTETRNYNDTVTAIPIMHLPPCLCKAPICRSTAPAAATATASDRFTASLSFLPTPTCSARFSASLPFRPTPTFSARFTASLPFRPTPTPSAGVSAYFPFSASRVQSAIFGASPRFRATADWTESGLFGPPGAGGGLSAASVAAISIGCLLLVGLVIAAVVLLRRRGGTDGRESEVFRDLYVGVDSTYDNPMVTEQDGDLMDLDGVFGGQVDESRV
jgi:hypothetical protein